MQGRGWRDRVRATFSVGQDAFSQFLADKCPRLAAALAYYTLFSIVPLLYLVLMVASLAFDSGTAREAILTQVRQAAGPDIAQMLREALEVATDLGGGVAGAMAGGVLLLVAATTVFGELQGAINQVWGLQAPKGKPLPRILRERGLSALLVFALGALLAASMLTEVAVAAVAQRLYAWPWLMSLLHLGISFGGLTLFLAGIYKVLPDAVVRWRDVWWGAALTAAFLAGGKLLIGYYVGRTAATSNYGAAGALAALLIWVYLASLLFFMGAELTEIRAHRRGAIRPRRGAIRVLPQRVPLPLELAPARLAKQEL